MSRGVLSPSFKLPRLSILATGDDPAESSKTYLTGDGDSMLASVNVGESFVYLVGESGELVALAGELYVTSGEVSVFGGDDSVFAGEPSV